MYGGLTMLNKNIVIIAAMYKFSASTRRIEAVLIQLRHGDIYRGKRCREIWRYEIIHNIDIFKASAAFDKNLIDYEAGGLISNAIL